MLTKQNFPLDTRVKIVGFPDNDKLNNTYGTILGKSVDNILDFYIVLLDNPTETHKAISVIESCLEAVYVTENRLNPSAKCICYGGRTHPMCPFHGR